MFTKSLLAMLATVCLCSSNVFSQDPGPGTVTVYSEDGEKFTLYLNGDRKNEAPSARVSAHNITEVAVAFRISFENSALTEIKKNGIRQGTNCLYAIEKNKKGEYVLKMKGCNDEPVAEAPKEAAQPQEEQQVVVQSTPDQLSATYSNGVISINDGRTLTVKQVKANGMTYPQVFMTALTGANVTITYDDNDEKYGAEPPFKYEVKDFSNNNAYFTLTVDEGGPSKTWKVKLQNKNGYDLKIEQ